MTMTDAQIRAAIREAHDIGRVTTARTIKKWIGDGALTISADALRTEVGRHATPEHGYASRLREGVDPTSITYDQASPQPDGSDPYVSLWNYEELNHDEVTVIRHLVRDTLEPRGTVIR